MKMWIPETTLKNGAKPNDIILANNTIYRIVKICVLQPDYSTSDVDYKNYDPPRDISHLMPEADFDYVFLNKLTTYKQLKELSKNKYDVFVNLCEGYLDWSIPCVDVTYSLELLNLPFTGPTTQLNDPPKQLMKYVAFTEGVETPPYILVKSMEDVHTGCRQLAFPLFVKPAHVGDSLGIDSKSLVNNEIELKNKVAELLPDYQEILVEKYIAGREFTVLVAAQEDGSVRSFQPIEFIFPEGNLFKTYALKTSELHPKANVPVPNKELSDELRDKAVRIFKGFGGVGYARLDFRQNDEGLYFLEINFTCSVFYSDGYEGSADYILKHDGIGQSGFLRHIVKEGIERHRQKQKVYRIRSNSMDGYGLYAQKNILKGNVIVKGEGRPQRVISNKYVKDNWTAEEQIVFSRYAYPLSKKYSILWSDKPEDWVPQNHSCQPNTKFIGLDIVAKRNIAENEELTLDYHTFCGPDMMPFDCKCGAPNCRGRIFGKGFKNKKTLKKQGESRMPLFGEIERSSMATHSIASCWQGCQRGQGKNSSRRT